MIYTLIGLIGVAIYVTAYFAIYFWHWNTSGLRYLSCNISGAMLTIISLIHNFNLAAFIAQVIWLLISLYGVGQIFLKQQPKRTMK